MNCFPKSFLFLQQESILTKYCILNGFDSLVRGNFDDVYIGDLYSAFFNLSIGFERIMKLAIITDYMFQNDYNTLPESDIRQYGHNLTSLYTKCLEITNKYKLTYNKNDDINNDILILLDDFANAQKGRYANISNLNSTHDKIYCPIDSWKKITYKIRSNDLRYNTKNSIERKINNNQFLINGYFENLAKGVDIIDETRLIYTVLKTNRYAIWRIINILKPISELLENLSLLAHKKDTEVDFREFPSFPYYDDFFKFQYFSKTQVLKTNKWTDLKI